MAKTLRQWVREHRAEIDAAILRACPGLKLNDEDRAMWVENDEGLYQWAKSEGVRV
jgi:gluconate kinase